MSCRSMSVTLSDVLDEMPLSSRPRERAETRVFQFAGVPRPVGRWMTSFDAAKVSCFESSNCQSRTTTHTMRPRDHFSSGACPRTKFTSHTARRRARPVRWDTECGTSKYTVGYIVLNGYGLDRSMQRYAPQGRTRPAFWTLPPRRGGEGRGGKYSIPTSIGIPCLRVRAPPLTRSWRYPRW